MDGWKINFLWEGLVSRDVVLVVTGILGGGWRQDVGLQIHTLLDSWTSLKRWIPIAYSHIAHRGNVLFFVKRFFSRWHRTCNLGEWLCDRRRTDRTCTKNYSPNDGEKNHFEEFPVWLKKNAFSQTWVPALKLTVCHRKSMFARWNVLLRMAYVTLGSGSVIFDTPRKLTCPLKINGWFRSIFLFKNSSFLGDQFVHFRRQKLMFQLMIWTAMRLYLGWWWLMIHWRRNRKRNQVGWV